MAASLLLALLAASQPASAEGHAFGFLWSMAGQCYGTRGAPGVHWARNLCVERRGAGLHIVERRRLPRYDLQRACDLEVVGPRRLAFRCSHTGPGEWAGTAEVVGDTWIVSPMVAGYDGVSEPPLRWIWRRQGDGLMIERQVRRDGRWQGPLPSRQDRYRVDWDGLQPPLPPR